MQVVPEKGFEWCIQTQAPGARAVDIVSITDKISVSGLEAAICPELLAASGIRSILTLLSEPERTDDLWVLEHLLQGREWVPSFLDVNGGLHPDLKAVGIQEIVFCNLRDCGENSPKVYKQAVSELKRLTETAAPVLVHCSMGVSRTPAIVSAFLAIEQGIPFKAAVDQYAKKRRLGIDVDLARTLTASLGLDMRCNKM